MIAKVLAVAVGGGIGAALRYLVTLLAAVWGGTSFPYGTAAVNIAGSFCIGFLTVWFANHAALPPVVRLFAVTGILGGFTTFSTFTMEFLTLLRTGDMTHAFLYGGLNVAGAFICCWLGIALGELTR